ICYPSWWMFKKTRDELRWGRTDHHKNKPTMTPVACPNNRAKISCSGLSPATAGESRLQPELAQRGGIIGPSPQWPMVLAFGFLDWEIVDAGYTSAHQSLLIKFPILVAIAAEPIAAVVMPFVRKPYCDTILTKGPDLLNQAVIQLPAPLARQK